MPRIAPKVLVNEEEYLPEFVALNEAWICNFFELEQVDLDLAANPRIIIDDGGYVLTLLDQGCVVGVCALFNQGNGAFQLARMAVRESFQGMGYGNLLMEAALGKLKELKSSQISLLTNSKLIAAIGLYKKFGFKVTRTGEHPLYKRVDIVMNLTL